MNSNALLVDAHQMLTLPNPTGKRNCSLLCLLVSGTGTNNFSLVAKLVVHRSRASERDSPQRAGRQTCQVSGPVDHSLTRSVAYLLPVTFFPLLHSTIASVWTMLKKLLENEDANCREYCTTLNRLRFLASEWSWNLINP